MKNEDIRGSTTKSPALWVGVAVGTLTFSLLLTACAPVLDETDAVLLAIEGASYLYGQTRAAEDEPVDLAPFVEACQQGDPDACETVWYFKAKAEAERTGEFTPVLRYYDGACLRGVTVMCEAAETLREAM